MHPDHLERRDQLVQPEQFDDCGTFQAKQLVQGGYQVFRATLTTIAALFLVIPTGALALDAQSTSYKMLNSSLASGGGDSSSGSFRLNGTIGGNLIGSSSSASFRLDAGEGPQARQLLMDTPSGTTTTSSGQTGSGVATATSGGSWLFAPTGNGPLQTAGFIPLQGHPKSPTAAPPTGLTFPFGLFDFVAFNGSPGSNMTITITYPGTLPPGVQYWKYGPTPTDHSPHWYVLPNVVFTANTATLTIADGGLGDDDLLANSMIVDQGGPAYLPSATNAIPTLSEWGTILLSGLMGFLGFFIMRRRGQLRF